MEEESIDVSLQPNTSENKYIINFSFWTVTYGLFWVAEYDTLVVRQILNFITQSFRFLKSFLELTVAPMALRPA